jgi:hypothetical protein
MNMDINELFDEEMLRQRMAQKQEAWAKSTDVIEPAPAQVNFESKLGACL